MAKLLDACKSTRHYYVNVSRTERRFPGDPEAYRVRIYQRRTQSDIAIPLKTFRKLAEQIEELCERLEEEKPE